MKEFPVIFAGHRIQIALAQETHVFGAHQLIDGIRITAVLPVVEADCSDILVAAVNRFEFLVATQVGGDSRRGNRERQHKDHEHEQDGEQDVAVVLTGLPFPVEQRGKLTFALSGETHMNRFVVSLLLRQRESLRVVVRQILYLDGCCPNLAHAIATIDDVPFRCNEDIVTLQQEDLLVSVPLCRIAVIA
jgi:hypothetical protein